MNRRKKHAQLSEFWRRFRKNKAAVLGLVLLVLIIGMAVFADLIVPYSKCIEQSSGTEPETFLWNRRTGTRPLCTNRSRFQIFSADRTCDQSDGTGSRCNPWCKCRIFRWSC